MSRPCLNARKLMPSMMIGLCVSLLPLERPLAGQAVQVDAPSLQWEVGSIDGAPHTLWERILDAIVTEDRVYAIDFSAAVGRIFTVDGDFVDEFGRLGQGPGEFLRPTSLSIRGSTVSVSDVAQARINDFTLSGDFLETYRVDLPDGLALEKVSRLADSLLVGLTVMTGRLPGPDGVDRSDLRPKVIHWQMGGSERSVGTLTSFDGNPLRYRRGDREPWHLSAFALGPQGALGIVNDSTIAILEGMSGSIEIHSWRQDQFVRTSVIRLPLGGRETSIGERQRVGRWLGQTLGDESIVDFQVPERVPAWSAIDPQGAEGFWLRRTDVAALVGEQGERWDFANPEGQIQRSLEFPAGTRIMGIGEHGAVGVREGEFGEQYLQFFRVN